jgi:hypothetical protein
MPVFGSPALSMIDWFRRRRNAPTKAVDDFARVARDQGADLDYDRSERLAKLLKSEDSGNLEGIANLLGQSGNDTKPRSGWTLETPAITLPA